MIESFPNKTHFPSWTDRRNLSLKEFSTHNFIPIKILAKSNKLEIRKQTNKIEKNKSKTKEVKIFTQFDYEQLHEQKFSLIKQNESFQQLQSRVF